MVMIVRKQLPVLFNSARPLDRCENLTAVWNAYPGDKVFKKGGYIDLPKANRGYYPIVVTDEFIRNKCSHQKIIMIGHGLNGGKLYGIDQPHGQFNSKSCQLTDYYIASSEYGRQFAASSAGIPLERCPALGMPRTDYYVGKKKGDGNTVLAQYKRAYLYLPTFRAKYNQKRPIPNYGLLNSLLNDDEILVVKRHINTKSTLTKNYLPRILEIPNSEPTSNYLIDCDVVITDFSSALFDAYFLNKPSVLTADGGDDYLISRGMYMKYPDNYGSRFISLGNNNEEEFVALLRDAANSGMTEVENLCKQRTSDACDGHSVERVINFIQTML